MGEGRGWERERGEERRGKGGKGWERGEERKGEEEEREEEGVCLVMYLHDLVSGMEAVSTSDCGEGREGGREGGRGYY